MNSRALRRRPQRGQALVIFALAFLVVMGFASLAIDGSHVYLVHRGDQNAADAGALAGTNVLSKITTPVTAAPVSDSDPTVKAVHDVVSANGIITNWPSSCTTRSDDGKGKSRFSATWFDTSPGCGATTGFAWRVTVTMPPEPQNLVGACVTSPYDCVQVDITDRVTNYLLGALGTPVTQSFASATAYAKQVVPGVNFTKVPPAAIWLYEGQGSSATSGPTACVSTVSAQCFNRNKNPSKTQMVCGTGGCPTLWVQPGTNPTFIGIDAKTAVSTGQDTQPALYSNGDMLLQAPTAVCDPYNATSCNPPNTTNPEGYSVTPGLAPAGANIYCSSKNTAAGTACNTTAPGGGPALSTLTGREAAAPPNFTFAPVVPTAGPNCGALILNGEAVTSSSFLPATSACVPPAADPYTILPGTYDYIVINHGQYTFERGLYDITGKARVNTNASGTANGIDHSRENAATDFDLCNASPSTPTSCSGLTAGVWIGHGSLNFSPASIGISLQCALGQPLSGTQGGGGDPTIINGSGVSFRFESTSAGFVSTGEVATILLDGPTPGSLPDIKGEPILFDMENNGTIHLDAVGTSRIGNQTVASGFSGLVFQTQSSTAGGVELDPNLSGLSTKPALVGQIVAYSLTVFGGTSGTAVDFSAGYGSGTSVIVPTGRNEPEIIGNNLASTHPIPYQITDNGDGTETYTQFFADEWALDNYDTYFKINGGTPLFFSKPLWGTPNPPVQPPNDSAPDDNVPAYLDVNPDGTGPPRTTGYTVVGGQPVNQHDFYFTGTDASLATGADPLGRYKFETSGYWTWGHEKVAAGQHGNNGLTKDPAGANPASVSLTFPKQSGNTIQIQGYMTDGDRCGDYATIDVTLTQPGGPGGGSVAVPGGNSLMQ